MDYRQVVEKISSLCFQLNEEKKFLDPYVQSATRFYLRVERDFNENPIVEKNRLYGMNKPSLLPLSLDWFPWRIDLQEFKVVVSLNDLRYEDIIMEINYVLDIDGLQKKHQEQRLGELDQILQQNRQEELDSDRRQYLRAKEIVQEYEKRHSTI